MCWLFSLCVCVCFISIFFIQGQRGNREDSWHRAQRSAEPFWTETNYEPTTSTVANTETWEGGGGGGRLLVAILCCCSCDTPEFIGRLTGWKTRPRCCPSGCWRRRLSRIFFYDAIQSLRLKVFVSLCGKSQWLRVTEAEEQGTDARVRVQRHPIRCVSSLKDNNNGNNNNNHHYCRHRRMTIMRIMTVTEFLLWTMMQPWHNDNQLSQCRI